MKYLCIALAAIQAFLFTTFTGEKKQVIGVNQYEQHQTFEGFGTSSAWWSQTIDDEETAKEIARLLYDDETGLGLDIYRYNVGAGEKDNPDSRIGDEYYNRRAESFYVFNEKTGEYEFDFTRDKNARRMLDYAVEYGAKEIILFCNSPHFSMTASGHASGGLTAGESNHPKENYKAFVDYLLTIADWFVAQGYPVKAISPINEPQWGWGGWVSQEGCHYTADEAIELLELFAIEMQKRNSPYALNGPESGQLSPEYYEYIDKFFASDILNNFCDTYSGHSYWIDNKHWIKDDVGKKFREQFPDKKLEISEWCELPMNITDTYSIESGLYMANIIVQDLNLMNAVSWQSWTAVNGDGLLDFDKDGELVKYNRYYIYRHFANFIKPGMKRVTVMDSLEWKSQIATTAFRGNGETVLVMINNADTAQDIRLYNAFSEMDAYCTDAENNFTQIYDDSISRSITLSPKSITTVVLK